MIFPKRENFKASQTELIIVGSKNPVKIGSVEDAFTLAFSQSFIANGVSAASMVSDQPIGDEETLQGAKNRALNAKIAFPEASYWVGVEGGIAEDALGMSAFAWVYILDKEGKSGYAKTGSFYLPEAIRKLINSGMELGEADDHFFDRENSKQKGGAVGILTDGKLDRRVYYSQAVLLALIPFLNKNLF
ncbi:inosine/xanthosine triphosphatase [Algoriphagus sp. CAU 1675]|uniref:inosine/xanthosine triphosphatase n=1 Tax=Algoriphagus sp. CAU 1675 TaxID=3032597 RepID=UPI0023DCA758|nr:inosine/xanthosine triphosphatase [Algoriphagus sp. CAU 1675]MDF2156533.1 inosine/xanthosine triphosphatase [Algoriphagus sp. CAU 1675]